jgi:hypothetical protein
LSKKLKQKDMEKLISYMSVAYGLNENFWKIKKGLENDLTPILEMNGAIEFDNPLYITFYEVGGLYVNKIILANDALYNNEILLCDEDNDVYQYITNICDIDDFYNLCKELGM